MKYWKKRLQEQHDFLFYRTLNQAEDELKKYYREAYDKTKKDIEDLYDKISKTGDIQPNDLYKYNRLFMIQSNLRNTLFELGIKEEKAIRENLERMYKKTTKLVDNTFNFTMEQQHSMGAVVDSVWCRDGKQWSSRIWDNKAQLQERIREGLIDCVSRGVSKDEMVKTIMKDFGVGFNQADRIVRTELTYVQNQASLNRYIDAGVKQFQFLAEIDSRTSAICNSMNGKVFNIEDAKVGENVPPLHPNCRSTIVPVIKKGGKANADNKT